MEDHQTLLARPAQPTTTRIVLLVLDGVGDLPTTAQPPTAFEEAATPDFAALARRSSLGRLVPVAIGVARGTGLGHLASRAA